MIVSKIVDKEAIKLRSTPRFTPRDLRRFKELGRGTGTYNSYIPWHRVNRSDPSSMGRSHLQKWRGRQHELLSDLELVAFLFSTMHPEAIDIREQMPLSLDSAGHELNAYCMGASEGKFPGTLEIADHLGMKHPLLRDGHDVAPWIMTTDLLITLKDSAGRINFLAISVKPGRPLFGTRSWALLNLEREYWARRGVEWLLITSLVYDPLVGTTLKSTSAWALGFECSQPLLKKIVEQRGDFNRKNLTQILQMITGECGDKSIAQHTFWQGIWSGQLPFDLHRSWRPSAPFILVSIQKFWERNPIVSGRSAWPV